MGCTRAVVALAVAGEWPAEARGLEGRGRPSVVAREDANTRRHHSSKVLSVSDVGSEEDPYHPAWFCALCDENSPA